MIHSGYGGSILYDDNFSAENSLGEQIKIIDEKELKDSYGNVLKTKKGILPKFTIGNHLGIPFVNLLLPKLLKKILLGLKLHL